MKASNPALAVIGLTVMLFLSSASAKAQSDPLVGTWNVKTNVPFVAVMTFNAGGTTVEFDSAGTNSSASPGESIALGKWRKNMTGAGYFFKEENYVYDGSGNLSLLAITTVNLTLGATLNTFSGTGKTSFYHCSVSVCPGAFDAGPFSFQITGRRF